MAKDEQQRIIPGSASDPMADLPAEEVAKHAFDIASAILEEGVIPAATTIVHLSQHACSESVRANTAKAVIQYNIQKLVDSDAGKAEKDWVDGFIEKLNRQSEEQSESGE